MLLSIHFVTQLGLTSDISDLFQRKQKYPNIKKKNNKI